MFGAERTANHLISAVSLRGVNEGDLVRGQSKTKTVEVGQAMLMPIRQMQQIRILHFQQIFMLCLHVVIGNDADSDPIFVLFAMMMMIPSMRSDTFWAQSVHCSQPAISMSMVKVMVARMVRM